MGLLDDKVAIITGAARGQGEAEARLFHAEGASLVLTDVNPAGEALAKSLGDNVIFQRHDVTSLTDWHAVADLAKRSFGKVDILVNNAGITGIEPTDTIAPAEMQRYLDIHVFGPLFGIQTIVPLMPASGGSIVNIASIAALRGYPSYVGYGTSKWALRGLSRYAAYDLVGRGIRVNTVLPGGVDTPMIHGVGAPVELIDAARAAVPMKRFATATELAQTVLFLASDQSSYMTGAELVVDGGLNA
jgi:3alpha(or 20beta)-hydroxysteroid dehydrogenase